MCGGCFDTCKKYVQMLIFILVTILYCCHFFFTCSHTHNEPRTGPEMKMDSPPSRTHPAHSGRVERTRSCHYLHRGLAKPSIFLIDACPVANSARHIAGAQWDLWTRGCTGGYVDSQLQGWRLGEVCSITWELRFRGHGVNQPGSQ